MISNLVTGSATGFPVAGVASDVAVSFIPFALAIVVSMCLWAVLTYQQLRAADSVRKDIEKRLSSFERWGETLEARMKRLETKREEKHGPA